MRKHQNKIEDILSARKINFEKIDISDPTKEEEKKFMREHSQAPADGKMPLPPQIFLDDEYIGVSFVLK